MKRLIISMLTAVVLTGCAGMQSLPPSQLSVQKVVEAPGISKDEIFRKSQIWFTKTLRLSKAVTSYERKYRSPLEYVSKAEGLLIGSGDIFYPAAGYSLSEGEKAYWEVTFTIQEEIKSGKARLTFTNLTIFVPKLWCQNIYGGWLGAYEKPLTEVEDMEKVRPVLLGLADQLGEFLRAPDNEGNW